MLLKVKIIGKPSIILVKVTLTKVCMITYQLVCPKAKLRLKVQSIGLMVCMTIALFIMTKKNPKPSFDSI